MGLEMVEIVMETEKQFKVELPFARVSECRTYGDLLDLITACVNEEQPPVKITESAVDSFLRELLINQYSVRAECICHEAELYGKELNLG
jgi:hypothetical protein